MKKYKILFIFFVSFIFSIFIFGNKVYAENISGFDASVSTKKGGTVEFGDVTLDGESSKMVKITGTKTYGYYQYDVTGLDPNKIYIVSADLKTQDVTDNGGIIGIETLGETVPNWGFSKGISGSNDWTKSKIAITSKKDGSATIFIGIGHKYGSYEYGFSTGTVYIKNISISDASNDSSVIIGESDNKKIKMVTWKTDYDSAGITDIQFQNFLNRLEDMYDNMVDLVGNSSHGKLYPESGRQVVYLLTNIHQYAALSGYPVEVNSIYANSHLIAAKTDIDISWTLLHETGHLFDLALSNEDGTYITSKDRFSMNHEQTASFYPLYAMEKMNTYVTDYEKNFNQFVEYFKNTYETTIAQGTYSGDGFSYLLTQVKKDGKIDWDAFKNTYMWFNDLDQDTYDTSINKENNYKIMWYLKKLDDYSETDVRAIFKDDEIEIIIGKYEPFESITLTNVNQNSSSEIDDKIELTNNYQLNVVTAPATNNDILVYESSNENVATIDDFGNVTLKPTSKSSVTITVRSFLNSNIKTSYEFKVTPTLTEEEDKNSDTTKDENNTKDIVKNPQTGVYYSLSLILIILGIGISMIIYSKKYNKFPKI